MKFKNMAALCIALLVLMAFMPQLSIAPSPVQGGSLSAFAVAQLSGNSGKLAQAPEWLTINGRGFTYRGQPVTLRGANFANIRALGAYLADSKTDRIGTGKVADMVEGLADYQLLQRMGGNHVRLGIDYLWYIRTPDAFWAALDAHVGYAEQTGTWLLLNSFGNPAAGAKDSCYEGYSASCDLWGNNANETALINWWSAIAARYKDRPALMGIDPVNEPTPPESLKWSTYWLTTLAPRFVNAVAKINPNLLIFVEAGSDAYFPKLIDGNVVYQAHFYSPLGGTHCAVNGSNGTYPGNFTLWDGANVTFNAKNLSDPNSRASIYADMQALEWAKKNNVPFYVGEWGISTESCFKNGLVYMRDVAESFNREGVHWAMYSWRAGERRWGTFPEVGELAPYTQAKYEMLVQAFGGAVPVPTPAPTVVVQVPTGTPTPRPSTLPTNTRKPRTPTPSTPTPSTEQWRITGKVGDLTVDLTVERIR